MKPGQTYNDLRKAEELRKMPFVHAHNIGAAENLGPLKDGKLQSKEKIGPHVVHHYYEDDSGDHYFVVHKDNDRKKPVVSGIHVTSFYDHEAPEKYHGEPYVQHSATKPEHQGKGMGTAAYQSAVKHFGTLLSSTAMSPASNHVWTKMGEHPNISVKLSSKENSPHVATWKPKKTMKKSLTPGQSYNDLQKSESSKPRLMGSASSKEQLVDGIKKFYYSPNITLHDNGDGTHAVHNAKGKIDGVHVREHKGRWRFEAK